jgi:hypothetical protein
LSAVHLGVPGKISFSAFEMNLNMIGLQDCPYELSVVSRRLVVPFIDLAGKLEVDVTQARPAKFGRRLL